MSKITDEMVEASAFEIAAKIAEEDRTPGYGPHKNDMEWLAETQRREIARRIREAGARAALPAIEAQGEVKVKPLEWRKYHGSEFLSFVETVVGRYRAWSHHEAKGVWYWRRNDDVGGNADSETAAKAAAQADYERRILSALTHPVPARESENARQEAVDAFIARLDGLVRKNEEAYAAAVADFRAAFCANHAISEET